MSALPRFVVLYAAMYAAYGVASPFLPAFVNSRGIAPEELGLVLGTGTAVASAGLGVIGGLQAAFLGFAAFAAALVPDLPHPRATRAEHEGVMTLVRLPVFRYLVLIAALVLGSHAMHDAFAMIRWRAAGVGAQTGALLWSEAVLAEVLVFFLLGPALVRRLTPPGALALAALAGVV